MVLAERLVELKLVAEIVPAQTAVAMNALVAEMLTALREPAHNAEALRIAALIVPAHTVVAESLVALIALAHRAVERYPLAPEKLVV
jgi:hypothetical protein